MVETLTPRDKELLLQVARIAIENRLVPTRRALPPPTEAVRASAGAFVTIRIRGNEPKLRGCIGHIMATDSLYDTVAQVAQASAFSDPRFPSLKASELADIELEISVLSPLRRIESVDEIVVGTHGLFIRRGGASGILLPQVASEQGWDRDAFVRHACLKAGLSPGCEDDDAVELSVFTAVVFDESHISM